MPVSIVFGIVSIGNKHWKFWTKKTHVGRDEIVTHLLQNSADVNSKKNRISALRGGVLYAWACYQTEKCKNGENVVAILTNKLADANEVLTEDNVTILQLGKPFENNYFNWDLTTDNHFNKMQQQIDDL